MGNRPIAPRDWQFMPPPKTTKTYNRAMPTSRPPIDNPRQKTLEKRKAKITLPKISILEKD